MSGNDANMRRGSEDVRQRRGRRSPLSIGGLSSLGGEPESLSAKLDQTRSWMKLATDILQILGESTPPGQQIERLLEAIYKATSIDAIALRLPSGEDFPYYAQRGFSPEFVRSENLLAVRGPVGEALRDERGRPLLECMCGMVLSGNIDVSKSFFTDGGSFWTNSTTDLLAATAQADLGARTRNYCNIAGYESVALVPLKSAEGVMGLLQLNDRRRGCFTREMIDFLESIGAGIGVALGRQRSADLLRQSQKMEAIGRLAGGVAHDFRNQLTVIKGYAEMIKRRNLLADEGVRLLEEVLKAAERSTLLTSQLLAFSRKQSLQPRVVDLSEMVQDIGRTMGRLIGEDIRLVVRTDRRPCTVEIDPSLFQHAMMNLLTNARDAMPGGGEVTIETLHIEADAAFLGRHPDAGSGQYVVVVVKDNGCGMDEAMQSRIFEVFFTTKKGGRCAGLGLAMVHGFVKQSGGQIEVESRIGCGSTFKLYFPACAPRPALDGDLDSAPPRVIARPGRTVLTVEDEQPVRELMARMLRGGGHKVVEAASAEEALSMLERSDGGIDLLITDVVMTGLSGFQLARRVRENHPDLPILFLSGYPEADLHRRGMMVNRAELLTKPCSQEQLLEKVGQMLAAADKAKG